MKASIHCSGQKKKKSLIRFTVSANSIAQYLNGKDKGMNVRLQLMKVEADELDDLLRDKIKYNIATTARNRCPECGEESKTLT